MSTRPSRNATDTAKAKALASVANTKPKRVNFDLPADIYKKLQRHALDEDITIADLMRKHIYELVGEEP